MQHSWVSAVHKSFGGEINHASGQFIWTLTHGTDCTIIKADSMILGVI